MRNPLLAFIFTLGVSIAVAQDKPKGPESADNFTNGEQLVPCDISITRESRRGSQNMVIYKNGQFELFDSFEIQEEMYGFIKETRVRVRGRLPKYAILEIAEIYSNSKFDSLPDCVARVSSVNPTAVIVSTPNKWVTATEKDFGEHRKEIEPFLRFLIECCQRFQ